MRIEDEIVIHISKLKIARFMLLCLAVAAGSTWLVTLDAEQLKSFDMDPIMIYLIYVVGYMFMVLCGLGAIYYFIKLFDSKPGIVFSHEGIADNSMAGPVRFIPWTDILYFSEVQIEK